MIKLLDECREIRNEIKEIEEDIEEITLRVSAPKSQSFDDMPKATSKLGNSIETYIEKKERLEEEREELIQQLESKWKNIVIALNLNNITIEEKLLLYYRFHEGYSWRHCGNKLKWNDNKVFRIYSKIRKSIENNGAN